MKKNKRCQKKMLQNIRRDSSDWPSDKEKQNVDSININSYEIKILNLC